MSLIASNITIKYIDKNNIQTTPVNDLSFNVPVGDIVSIVGRSGVGKTTLVKGISGLIKLDTGVVTLDGEILSPKTHKIGYVTQDYGLYNFKKVKSNIELSAKIKKVKYNKEEFDEIVSELNIQDKLNKYPKKLSGGEKQRVAIARSLLLKPDVLIMDEPFSALDEITKIDAVKLFVNICNRHNLTTIVITHSIDEAINISNKILIQNKSSIDEIILDKNLTTIEKSVLKQKILSRL